MFVTLNGFAYQCADWPGINLGKTDKPKEMTEEEIEAAERRAMAMKRTQSDNAEMEIYDMDLFLASLSSEDLDAFNKWSEAAYIEVVPNI